MEQANKHSCALLQKHSRNPFSDFTCAEHTDADTLLEESHPEKRTGAFHVPGQGRMISGSDFFS